MFARIITTPPSEKSPELTVLILCRDEEQSIARCVGEAREFLNRHAIAGEVLVVDNASRDRSAEFAEEAGARVVQESRAGYGNAVNAGIRAARGRLIILGDGDGEHDLGALAPFWEKLQGGCDFVFGNRFAGGIEDGAMSFLHRYVGSPLLSGLGRLFFRAPVGDFHCGLRGFKAASVRALALQCPGMECSSEMVVKAARRNMRIAEAPVVQRRAFNPDRSSHLRTWRDGWRHLRLLLMLSPRWLFLYPGCVLLAAGALAMAAPFLVPAGFGVYTMLFGSTFIISGVQLAAFHLLAHVFGDTIGFTDGRLWNWVRQRRVLEPCLAAGCALALAGTAGGVWSLFVWAQTGPAAIETRLTIAIPSVAMLVAGVQTMFSGFLLALIATQGAGARGES